MRRSNFAIALWLAAALAAGCSSSSSSKPAPTPACHPDATTCAANGDCCSQQCNGVICVAAGTVCKHIGDTGCTVFDPANPRTTDCCDGTCSGTGPSATCKTLGQCALLGEACTGDGDCCNTTKCDTGTHVCVVPPPPPCTGVGGSCSVDDNCCEHHCDPVGHQCKSGGGCTLEGYACAKDTDCCGLSCPGAGMPGATCASTCRPSGATTASLCSDGSQCCSGICDATAHCAPVPSGTSSCKTLGEYCPNGNADCCSENCVAGTSGSTCQPAYSGCNATGDICNGPNDCCTGLCSVAAGSPTPGRCASPTGSGCTEDGLPCGGNSNCCTRKCVDLGSGITVCQPAGGCRMTGDFCDSTQSCCGGTDPNQATSTTTMLPSPYGVYCDLTGKANTSPNWDPSSKDNHVCSSGQSCNPPGNICGGSDANHVPASQNCCNSNPTGSGKDVCKPDMNGIMRCFGGGSATCPAGYDATNPACCIPDDGICNMQSECCGFAPCSADANGILRCNGSACKAIGTQCTADAQCCSGTTCVPIPEMGFSACATAPPPNGCSKNIGQACGGSNGTCCVGSCITGVCNYACGTTGAPCSTNANCCSGICDGTSHCATACVAQGGTCGADADCCQSPTALTCPLAPGSTTGTCTGSTCAATGASCTSALCCNATDTCTSGICRAGCAATGASCATSQCCNASDTCTGNICTAPPSCPDVSQSCSTTNPCCSGLDCHMTTGTSDFPYTCTAGASACFCEDCAAQGESCTATFGCCLASQSYCATATLSSCGVGDTNCLCRDARL